MERVVMLRAGSELPEISEKEARRECVVELKPTGEWLIAKYNESIGKWNVVYAVPVADLPTWSIARWAYLDELFIAHSGDDSKGEFYGGGL